LQPAGKSATVRPLRLDTPRSQAHPDAFTDVVGAEAAVSAWRRHLVGTAKASAFMVNQAIAAVTVLYEHGRPAPGSSQRAWVGDPLPAWSGGPSARS